MNTVAVPSERSGSIWKMPPWAQSFDWIFIEMPGPVRPISISSSSSSTVMALVSALPRWFSVFSANTGVRRPPVMSSTFGAPVSVQFVTPKVAAFTVDSTCHGTLVPRLPFPADRAALGCRRASDERETHGRLRPPRPDHRPVRARDDPRLRGLPRSGSRSCTCGCARRAATSVLRLIAEPPARAHAESSGHPVCGLPIRRRSGPTASWTRPRSSSVRGAVVTTSADRSAPPRCRARGSVPPRRPRHVEPLERDPHPILARLRAGAGVVAARARGLDRHAARPRQQVMRDTAAFTVDDPRFSTARVVGPSMLSLDGRPSAIATRSRGRSSCARCATASRASSPATPTGSSTRSRARAGRAAPKPRRPAGGRVGDFAIGAEDAGVGRSCAGTTRSSRR